jgi:Zn-dependent protease
MLFKIFPYGFFSEVLLEGAIINLILTVFNLVPIPPLDGSRVVAAMLPYKFSMAYLKAGLIGSFLIFSLILVGFSKWFIMPVVIKIISLWGITVTV